MTTKSCNQSTTPPKKLSLRSRSAFGVAAQIVLLTSSFWVMPFINVAKSAVIFVSDFEAGFTEWGKELCCDYSAQIVNSPVRAGKQAVKITLNKTDPDAASSKRAELRLSSVPADSEQWYGLSIFLPSSHVKDPSTDILTQWHSRPDKNLGEEWPSPPLHLNTNNGNWRIHRRWDPNEVTKNNTPGPGGGVKTVDIGSYQNDVGKWTDWVFHVKWSYQSDGLVEVWKNGVLVLKETGPNTYNDAQGPYQKIGIYKFDWKSNPSKSSTTQRVVYFDEVRVGDASITYQDVAPPRQ